MHGPGHNVSSWSDIFAERVSSVLQLKLQTMVSIAAMKQLPVCCIPQYSPDVRCSALRRRLSMAPPGSALHASLNFPQPVMSLLQEQPGMYAQGCVLLVCMPALQIGTSRSALSAACISPALQLSSRHVLPPLLPLPPPHLLLLAAAVGIMCTAQSVPAVKRESLPSPSCCACRGYARRSACPAAHLPAASLQLCNYAHQRADQDGHRHCCSQGSYTGVSYMLTVPQHWTSHITSYFVRGPCMQAVLMHVCA